MLIIDTSLDDVKIIQPTKFCDSRGYFFEAYNKERYVQAGIKSDFVQDNCSFSRYGTIRGLHYQLAHPQAKLVQVLRGAVYDVAVDIRVDSPTFRQWVGVELSDENGHQLYVPEGFAHGFCVLSDEVIFSYKCSDYYIPSDEGGILWSDTSIGIKWPDVESVLSEKDQAYPCLKTVEPTHLPKYSSLRGGA